MAVRRLTRSMVACAAVVVIVAVAAYGFSIRPAIDAIAKPDATTFQRT